MIRGSLQKILLSTSISLLVIFLGSSKTFAQANNSDSTNKTQQTKTENQELKLSLQKHLKVMYSKMLARYMDANSYKVLAKVTVEVAEGQNIPYLPRPRSMGSMKVASYDSIDALLNKANIKILLDKGYGKKDIEIVQNILEEEFAVFGTKIDLEFKAVNFPKRLAKDDPKLKKAEDENSKLKSNNDDIKSAKRRLELKLETLLDTIKKKDIKIEDLAKDVNINNLLRTKSPLLVAVFAVMLALTMFILVFRKFGQALSSSITEVSSSLSEVGQSIASSAESDSDDGPEASEADGGEASKESNVSMSLEEIKTQITALQVELKDQITDKEIPRLISYIKQSLSEAHSRPQMVLAMELLGNEMANRLYGLLDSSNKAIIVDQLGQIDKITNKLELMFQAGEGLKSALFGENYQGLISNADPEVMKYLTIAKDRHVYELLDGLSQEELSRLLLYLDSSKTSEILEYCYIHKKEVYETALKAVAEIDSCKDKNDLDKNISESLNQIIENDETEKRLPFLMHIQNIIENISNGTELEIAESVGKNNPIIKTYIDQNLVTLGMFFTMLSDQQQLILDRMNNKNVAALIYIRKNETDSETIYKALPERRVDLIKDEVKKLENLSDDKKKQRCATAKQNIITYIMEARAADEPAAEAPLDDKNLDSVA
jgi:hypothetical protein